MFKPKCCHIVFLDVLEYRTLFKVGYNVWNLTGWSGWIQCMNGMNWYSVAGADVLQKLFQRGNIHSEKTCIFVTHNDYITCVHTFMSQGVAVGQFCSFKGNQRRSQRCMQLTSQPLSKHESLRCLNRAVNMADSASESDTDGAGSSSATPKYASSSSKPGVVISPFRLEELTNRLASLQQENKVLKIELETFKLKCKALQEENQDLRKASVTMVSNVS